MARITEHIGYFEDTSADYMSCNFLCCVMMVSYVSQSDEDGLLG